MKREAAFRHAGTIFPSNGRGNRAEANWDKFANTIGKAFFDEIAAKISTLVNTPPKSRSSMAPRYRGRIRIGLLMSKICSAPCAGCGIISYTAGRQAIRFNIGTKN